MTIAQFGFLLVVLIVCSFAPGFFFVRKLRWSPLEKLCAAVGLSLLLIYLAAFGIYLLGVSFQNCWLVTGLCAVMGLLSIRDVAKMLKHRQVRRVLIGLVFLLVWTILLLGLIRGYGGGGWGGDWYEHYHRTRFFLDRLPHDTIISGNYQVPARPPMMNLIAAHFLAHQPEGSFPAYQIVFVFLSLLVFLPCCLIAGALVRRGGRGVLILGVLFAFNPMFVQNVTYTWTKLLSGFYIVLAIALYLAGWRKDSSVRTVTAFGSLAAGALVHYSVGPYIVFLAAHYAVRTVVRLRSKWPELAASVALSGALLATWFGWSLSVYGKEATFGSNTAVIAASTAQESNLARKAANVVDTLVPHPLRKTNLDRWKQPNKAGYVRDYAFLIYQTSLIVAMGAVGGLAIAWLFTKSISGRAGPTRRGRRLFWLLLVIFCTIAGIAVVGEREKFGVAHICLLPLVFLGLTLLAGSFRRIPLPVRLGVLIGCAIDCAMGIMLHFRLQTMTFRTWRDQAKQYAVSDDGPNLSNFAMGNWLKKTDYGAVFLGDILAEHSSAIQTVLAALFTLAILVLALAAFNRGPLGRGGFSGAARLPRNTTGDSGQARRTARTGSGQTRGHTSKREPARRRRR